MRRAHRVRPLPERTDAERAVAVIARHPRLHHKRIRAVRIARHQRPARALHRIALAQARRRRPRDHRLIIRSGHRHRQQRAATIGCRNREALGHHLVRVQMVERVRRRVAPDPVRANHERAVATQGARLRHHRRRRRVHIAQHQRASGPQRLVRLNQLLGLTAQRRNIIGPGDIHRHRRLRAIHRGHREGVAVDLVFHKLVMRRARRVAPSPERINAEMTVHTNHLVLRNKRLRAVHIRDRQLATG